MGCLNLKKASIVVNVIIGMIIIGLFIFLFLYAFERVQISIRDIRRLTDVGKIQSRLHLYFLDKGKYPLQSTELGAQCLDRSDIGFQAPDNCGQVVYMELVPAAPFPRAERACQDYNKSYFYLAGESGATYAIKYCLAGKAGNIEPGIHWATPRGIADP